jgi:hypothetical protein
MQRLPRRPSFTCVTCEAAIAGGLVIHVGLPFCCAGCVAGGPCICSYDEETENESDQRAIAHRAQRDEAGITDGALRADSAMADDQRGLVTADR